ncbi:MAG: DUF397 domain-containing protein [Trebonia sp.]
MERNSDNWRKSTYSTANGGQCVEVGHVSAGVVVRDTADRTGAVLAVSAGAWRGLLAEIRAS